jgi:hypothetical protein
MRGYRTGVIYGHAGDEWTDGQPYSQGPCWYATPAQTAEVASQLRSLGYSVTEISR